MFEDNDQLYHDGIELDRAHGDFGKAHDLAIADRTFFSPTYEETKIANSPKGSISYG